MFQEVIRAFVIAGGLTLAFVFVRIGVAILRADRSTYARNRLRTRTTGDAIKGDVSPNYDGARDYQVAAGIAIDRRRNQWIEQGKLSNEAVANVLR
ncbi:MAG: hypothetical protein U1E23_07020 [Reyranellaceae bacterium]